MFLKGYLDCMFGPLTSFSLLSISCFANPSVNPYFMLLKVSFQNSGYFSCLLTISSLILHYLSRVFFSPKLLWPLSRLMVHVPVVFSPPILLFPIPSIHVLFDHSTIQFIGCFAPFLFWGCFNLLGVSLYLVPWLQQYHHTIPPLSLFCHLFF